MRYLIVNGDDFGATPGINAGIVEAHRDGILTSASLLVNTPWSVHAAHLARGFSSLGLHVHFDRPSAEPFTDDDYREELGRQLDRFRELTGRLPTHLDSHHDAHRDPRITPHFLDLACRYGLPVRRYGPIRFVGDFFAQWGGGVHLDHISPAGLRRILVGQVHDGVTELACHPGYVDAECRSSYAHEREAELRTLCDPAAREAIRDCGIRLVGFAEAQSLFEEPPRRESWPRS